ncbi:hypothetical protein NX059_010379 [Plenodomus lindquistii]|nr:hypothetical protein NX059_010379 [Plenodomus lindquistii]
MTSSPPPLASDLSRPALKRLAIWIRDDLDLLVAREGPDILRPDDVLALHDTFIALQHAQYITLQDLRATGIHKAVQDIAGVATRWPGRLCDDCDKIVRIWTAKFGPLSAIRPFLYGRGGRLEGIATASQYSREDLLARWAKFCPEAIHPQQSHQLGDLGFRVGSWWINPLFAHHAGIIGLEACEGGTTFDKNGAYALVLKGTGEFDAGSHEKFTYRVPQNDKGKFRLTAATPKSRDPIRVLRSHSINSIWAPTAGIRYEGLYSVKGWSIKQAKTADTAGGHWKEGDILYDVRFERTDPVPLSETFKHPTATEVDDYLEYKRLRKVHREGNRDGTDAVPEGIDAIPVPKIAPIIEPLQPQPTELLPEKPISPSRVHQSFFKKPQFDKKGHVHFSGANGLPIPDDDDASPFTRPGTSLLKVPFRVPSRLRPSSMSEVTAPVSPVDSRGSSLRTGASAINIKEVAPWIDYDANLVLPESPDGSSASGDRLGSQSLARSGEQSRDAEATNPSFSSTHRERNKSGNFKKLTSSSTKKDERKPSNIRHRGNIVKLFDGSVEDTSEDRFDFDRNAICPPSDWDVTPGLRALSIVDSVLVGVEEVHMSFTDPFDGGMKKRRERKDSSGVSPDEMLVFPRLEFYERDS